MSDLQRVPQQIIRGIQCISAEFCTRKNIEDAMDLVPDDDDVIIASFPKTGTTWLQYIVLQIKSKGESFPSFEDALSKIVPWIEFSGVAAVHAQGKPRFYRHHFPSYIVHKNPKSKVLYIYRHPEDTIVSYYNYSRNLLKTDYDFDEFFDTFISGNVTYGDYFQHVLSFYEHRNDDNLLMVSYEKLHANRKDGILRIAKFLGEEFYQSLHGEKDLLDSIMLHTSFDYMKEKMNLVGVGPIHNVPFFRKGIVGEGKVILSDAQRQILKQTAEKVLKGTSIFDEWYGH